MSWISNDIADFKDGGGLRASTILHLACYAGMFLLIAILAKSWSDERAGRAAAEATSQAEKRVQKEADERMEQRDKVWEKRLEELQKENREIRSLKQAVQVVEKYVPVAAPQQVKAEDLKPDTVAKLPDSPDGYTIRSGLQEMALAKELNQCQQDKGGFAKCEADKVDLTTKLESKTNEAKKWEQAAKGGSKWKRFTSALKYIGIGIGIGATLGAR